MSDEEIFSRHAHPNLLSPSSTQDFLTIVIIVVLPFFALSHPIQNIFYCMCRGYSSAHILRASSYTRRVGYVVCRVARKNFYQKENISVVISAFSLGLVLQKSLNESVGFSVNREKLFLKKKNILALLLCVCRVCDDNLRFFLVERRRKICEEVNMREKCVRNVLRVCTVKIKPTTVYYYLRKY